MQKKLKNVRISVTIFLCTSVCPLVTHAEKVEKCAYQRHHSFGVRLFARL
jgi:hypothetical protein